MSRRVILLGLTAGLLGWTGVAQAQLRSSVYVAGLSAPVGMVQDPSDPATQYVVEQGGRIRVIQGGTLQPGSFLDLAGVVRFVGEGGLLGLAFPADYATSGRFYVNFTREPDGHTVIARFIRQSTQPPRADPASRFDLEWVPGQRYIAQPFGNHNGGKLLFGPDGYLYIGLGDGGSGGDPAHRAQDPSTLLGKMLRVDPGVPLSDAKGYRIPPDNPFLSGSPVAARGEIWAFGLRNPWRFTVDDPAHGGTGAIVIGDVGQGAWEEIDYEPAGRGGRNYGWRNFEGTHPFNTLLPPAYLPLTPPIHEYPRSVGQSVTGGYVYRGVALGPAYRGRYVFGDFSSGRVFSLGLAIDPATGEATVVDLIEHTAELGGSGTLGNISSIDVDAAGELYLVSYGSGRILRVTAVLVDADGDGLPDTWEAQFGLDPASAAGADGASGDPDGDGRTNLAEYQQGTHPRGFVTRYLAEGVTSGLFDTTIALANPGATPAAVLLRFLRTDGAVASRVVALAAMRQALVDPRGLPGLADAAFSVVVESDELIVVDRTISWDRALRYGAHSETAVVAPAPTWYLAEGATHAGFNLFYLVQNPNPVPVTVRITYLLPAPAAPFEKLYTIGAAARFTVWVNFEDARLASTAVSAVVTSLVANAPIVVERAMYLDAGGLFFGAGHAGAAIPSPSTTWFLAEGATGSYFDLFVLMANPSATDALVDAAYLLPDGSVVRKPYVVPANSRFSIWVDREDARLADTGVAASFVSTNGVPIVVERAMWWPEPSPGGWQEGHVSAGSTQAATRWAVADGRAGGVEAAETYLLVANVSGAPGLVRVTLLLENAPPVARLFPVAASSRTNVTMGVDFPEALGRRFGVLVESLGPSPAPIVVERATYWDAAGVRWAAGTSALAARLP